jgi:hypothetical protein
MKGHHPLSRQPPPLQYHPGWIPWQHWESHPEVRGPLRVFAMALLGLMAVLALLLLAGQLW